MSNVKKFVAYLFPIVLRALLLVLEKEVQKQIKKELYGKPKTHQFAETQSYAHPDGFRRVRSVSRTEDRLSAFFPTRKQAQELLDDIKQLSKRYTAVTVADFYELNEMTCTREDDLKGWTESQVAGLGVERTGTGFTLHMPRPKALY